MEKEYTITQIEEKIDRAVRDCGMRLEAGVLVALSGGADSCALLHYLYRRAWAEGFSLCAAHLNHQIRGEEADRDEAFCKNLCADLGVPFYSRAVDIPALAKSTGRGLEETARAERYAFFEEILAQNRTVARIATAHTASDNAETVLFHLVRGSGIRGLCGIPPVRDGKIIRPLIDLTKEEILFYCAAYGLSFVRDSTNEDPKYTRNYIRGEILPRLWQITPNPEAAIRRVGSALRLDNDFIEGLADEFLARQGIDTEAEASDLVALHPALLARVLIRMHARAAASLFPAEKPNPPTLEQKHISALQDLLSAPEKGGLRQVSLPGKLSAVLERGRFFFAVDQHFFEKERLSPTYLRPGRNEIRPGGALIYLYEGAPPEETNAFKNIYKLFIHIILNSDRIKGKLYIRSRKDGDQYRFGSMTRKVKKLLADARIPLAQRDTLPLLCDGDGIVWIPGFGIRDDCAAAPDGTPLHVFYVRE